MAAELETRTWRSGEPATAPQSVSSSPSGNRLRATVCWCGRPAVQTTLNWRESSCRIASIQA